MLSEKKKKQVTGAVKGLLVLLAVFLLAIIAEVLIFNRMALGHSYEPIVIDSAHMTAETTETLAQLSAEEQKAIEVEQETKRMMAEYNGEEYVEELDESLVEQDGVIYQKVKTTQLQLDLSDTYYIHKLKLELPVDENAGYTVSIIENGNLTEPVYCSINSKLDTGIANIGKSADALQISLLTVDEPKLDDLRITISNSFSLNGVRICFFAVLFLTLYLILGAGAGSAEMMRQKPQWFFTFFALLFGGLLIMGIGTNQVSYDEYVHAKSAYKLSFGATIETTEAAMQMVGNTLPYFNNPEERELIEAYEDEMNDPDIIAPDIGHQSRFPRAETRVYYPMAAGFFLGRILHTSFADMVALAKLGNLLCYIFIVFWAVKKAKGYGMTVAAIGLLPNNIFIASALSYDALVTSCLLLAYVLLLNEILTPEEKIKPGNAFLMLIAFVIGCLSKPIYIVMALMLLFLPAKKFPNRWMAVVFKIAVMILAGLMIYNIFFPTPVAGGDYQLVSNAAYAGDKRSVGTSTTGQIAYILHNPLTYAKVLLTEMFGMLASYTLKGVPYVGYAYLGTASFLCNWLLIVLGIFSAVFAKVNHKIGKSIFWLTHLMNFGVAAIVFSSMYISYTAVGSNQILGVQGRYFIPLFLPFLSCFFAWGNGKTQGIAKVRERLHRLPAVYERVIFGVLGAVNLYMTWKLVILGLNV
jgi:uncharacterized membrane protein